VGKTLLASCGDWDHCTAGDNTAPVAAGKVSLRHNAAGGSWRIGRETNYQFDNGGK
jgi:hypothetical protein